MPKINYLKTILIMAITLITSPSLPAQSISVRASFGVVDLPLSDWSKFFNGQSNSFYVKNNPNLYYALSFHYPINTNHSISVGTELIRTSALLTDPIVTVDWRFHGIPITLGYEYRTMTFNERFTPVVGAGVSYFFSQVNAKDHFFNQTSTRTGNGYGIHASLGLISQLTTTLSFISQGRYRYSDGMAFSGSKNDIKVQFSGFDFSIGLAWDF